MNSNFTKRITVSLPGYLYQQLLAQVQPRAVSSFVADAVSSKVAAVVASKMRKTDPWNDFLALGRTLPKVSYRKIREGINKGRM